MLTFIIVGNHVMDHQSWISYHKLSTWERTIAIGQTWPDIDDALRSAAFRGVSVRLLVSNWTYSRPAEFVFLESFVVINDALPKTRNGKGSIEVKRFVVPSTEEQKKISFARVNHNKYMMTDKAAYVGTSIWAGYYFISTACVGLAMTSHESEGIAQKLQAIFDKD